jgi:hypothetical protein
MVTERRGHGWDAPANSLRIGTIAEHEAPKNAKRIATAQGILAMGSEVRANLVQIEQETEALLTSLEAAHQGLVKTPALRPVQPSQHLRERRPEPPQKNWPVTESRAFVEARFNRMTFEQIADDVAQHFQLDRRVGKFAIHDGWHSYFKRKQKADPR